MTTGNGPSGVRHTGKHIHARLFILSLGSNRPSKAEVKRFSSTKKLCPLVSLRFLGFAQVCGVPGGGQTHTPGRWPFSLRARSDMGLGFRCRAVDKSGVRHGPLACSRPIKGRGQGGKEGQGGREQSLSFQTTGTLVSVVQGEKSQIHSLKDSVNIAHSK